ncbi:TROVE domain-containing protein, partial [Actinocatenispora thailandica]
MADALAAINLRRTRQDRPADPRQAANNAGGYGFTVTPAARLHRFLTLGVAEGTYYTGAPELAADNAQVVLDAARADAAELVRAVVEVSTAGRAPRQHPAVFALAAASALGDVDGRRAAFAALPQVCRTGTHLFLFARYREQFAGWGRGARRAVARWYLGQGVDRLEYQLLKYRQREGWTHRDLLRLAHPVSGEPARRALFDLVCGRDAELADLPLYRAYLAANSTGDVATWVRLIGDAGLSWEMLPDAALTEPDVWAALLDRGLPQTALLRQLPRLTRLGLLAPMSARAAAVAAQLADPRRLSAARVHPVSVLVAARTYAAGASGRSDRTWVPSAPVVDGLDAAFYAAYGAVRPAGKRTLLALDVSGSMTVPAGGLPVSCREASAALALVTAATEPAHAIVGFTGGGRGWTRASPLTPLAIGPRQRLDDVVAAVSNLPFGRTDCALPMVWARERGVEVDTFVVLTDNETWAGDVHPHQALADYRAATGIAARLVVAALTPTRFTIADPSDAGMLDVSGFDSAVPGLIADFS